MAKKAPGFTLRQHRQMADILYSIEKHLYLPVAWRYGKTSKVARLARNVDKAIGRLKCELDDLAGEEYGKNYNLFYYGENEKVTSPWDDGIVRSGWGPDAKNED